MPSLICRALAPFAPLFTKRLGAKNLRVCGSTFSALAFVGLTLFPLLEAHAQGFADFELMVNQHLDQQLKSYANTQGWHVLRTGAQHQWPSAAPPACTGVLSLKASPAEPLARQRITLTCSAPSWQITVISEPALWVKAAYATQSLERGEPITLQNTELRELAITRSSRDFYSALKPVLGLGAKRRIRAGQLLSPTLLAQAKLVSRGEQVRIIASQQGISASTQGQALSDGAQDEIIRVRNNASEKVIEAKVIGKGEVSSLY